MNLRSFLLSAGVAAGVALIVAGTHTAQRARHAPLPPIATAGVQGAAIGAQAATIAAPPAKLTCFVVGDSIAEMIAPFLPCAHSTKVGIGTAAIVTRVQAADITVVSASSNDVDNGQWSKLDANLTALARKLGPTKAIWILPSNGKARTKVRQHMRSGDREVIFKPGGTRGQAFVHPGCPKCVAADILVAMKALGWE